MKQFKKAKVVLIPTENINSPIAISLGVGEFIGTQIPKGELCISSIKGWSNAFRPQQFLIISEDEIVEKDHWFNLDNNYINNGENWKIANMDPSCKKIIASYPSLKRETNKAFINKSYIPQYIIQPQPTQQFIEHYIESYNKGEVITDVLVEYECTGGIWNSSNETTYRYNLKVNPKDNTITIKKRKDSWNREELIAIVKKFSWDYTGEDWNSGDDKWIEQNL